MVPLRVVSLSQDVGAGASLHLWYIRAELGNWLTVAPSATELSVAGSPGYVRPDKSRQCPSYYNQMCPLQGLKEPTSAQSSFAASIPTRPTVRGTAWFYGKANAGRF